MMFTSDQFSLLEGRCLTCLTVVQRHSYVYHLCLYKWDDAIAKKAIGGLSYLVSMAVAYHFHFHVTCSWTIILGCIFRKMPWVACDGAPWKVSVGTAIRKTDKKGNETSLLDAYQNPSFTSVATYLFVPSFIHFFYAFAHSFIFRLTVVSKKNPQGEKKSRC